MHQKIDIRETLIELRKVFQGCAIELMSVMFNIKPEVIEAWDVAETSDARYDYIFRQIGENRQFKANTIIGASYSTLEKVFGRNIDLEYARDAFGEFSNCYYSILMENQYFVENFGILRQRVPEDSIVLACFPIAWGVQGKLYIDCCELFMRFSIEENRLGDDILSLLEKKEPFDNLGDY